MNILLLGPFGQVGWELQRALAPLGSVVTAGRGKTVHEAVDLSAAGAGTTLLALAQRVQPGLIVNAAAHTAVDRAEGEPERARAINAEAPAALAGYAASAGVPLVHYSSDYVFDGSGSEARDESASTGPLNVYGHSKLQGEAAIRESGCKHLILRTSWVYAARGGNFARTMLRLAAERDNLNVIDDQVGAPSGAELLADVTAHAVRHLLADTGVSGTYHCAASGFTSWHGYASHVLTRAAAHGVALKVGASALRAIHTSDYPTPARRPLNSRLDCSKLQHTFGVQMPPWQLGVDRMLSEVLGA